VDFCTLFFAQHSANIQLTISKQKAVNHSNAFSIEKNFQGFSLIIAPLLFAVSTFFWVNGEYGVIAATLGIVSLFFCIPALTGAFSLLKTAIPHYATYGLWIAVFGDVSGISFMFLGYLTTIFNISHTEYLEKLSEYAVSSQLLLFATGPIFPLSLLVLGINFIRTKVVEVCIGVLLCIGAIAFPASRITRIEWIAHVADVLLLIPVVAIGFVLLNKKQH
jgi:hypothetical protein